MGQNSPIELQMTSAGLAAKDNVDSIIFTRFVAGSGGNNLVTEVAEVKQTIPIVDFQKYTAGNTYNIDGVETVATESSLKLTGYGNAIDAEANYILNEIGLMAKLTEEGEEFCFAYDWSDTDTRRIRITRSQGIQVVYNIIFSRQPNLTVNTSATGVTYTDFYNHTQKAVGASPVHGLVWSNDQLLINGQVFDGLSNERLKKVVGIDLYYSMLPLPVMSLFEKVALVTTSNNIYRCQKTQEISSGQFIINDDGWKRANGSEAEALLVIDDGLTPSSNEICLTDAQNHFMEWVQLGNFESRLKYLEENNQVLQYDPLDNREYNTEWVDRMTGSGTPGSPFCIYTPKDFSMIGRTEQYGLDKCYKLMNNLDFSEVIGMSVDIQDEGYQIIVHNQEAPLYHNGEGLWPVGYDGYYPHSSEETPQTYEEAKASGKWKSSNGYRLDRLTGAVGLNYSFTGELDGNSKVIKGITCVPINTFSVGLFMFLTRSASVHNLTIKDSVFISPNVYCPDSNNHISNYLGSVGGAIINAGTSMIESVTIYNVYNYASLINNVMIATSYTDDIVATGGIIGHNGSEKVAHVIANCANHGNLMYVSETPYHRMAGIIFSYKDDSYHPFMVYNCINTSSFTAYRVSGIGPTYTDKLILNCGVLESYQSNTPEYNLGATQFNSDKWGSNCNIFFNNQSYYLATNYGQSSPVNQKWHIYSPEYLKSEEFITEANSYSELPVFVYNDLGVNDGWPLLVDEYNTIIGINSNLSLAVVDPVNRKIYKSGLPMKKFQTIPTYKEMVANTNQTVETKINTFDTEVLAGLKIVTITVSSSDWTAVEDNGVPTGEYKATKSVTGITTTSPVQLLTQLTALKIKITEVSSNSISLSTDTQPDSDLKVSIMFTA